jgi:hypothetical protein
MNGKYRVGPFPFGGPVWYPSEGMYWATYAPGVEIQPDRYYTVFTKNEVVMTRLSNNIDWDNVLFYEGVPMVL